jgi:hypothetical protein
MPTAYSSQSPPLYLDHDVVEEWPRKPRTSGVKSDQSMSGKRPIGRRIFRAITRFFIAVLIGVGVTLAWQSYGNEAIEITRVWAPSLGWLLPVSTTKSLPDSQGSIAAAAISPDLVHQLEPMALDLTVVRRSVEQLTTKVEQLAAAQEQMAQHIATMQAVEQDIRQTMSSPAQPRAAAPRKPAQPTGQPSAMQSPSMASQPPPSGPPLRLDGPAQPAR